MIPIRANQYSSDMNLHKQLQYYNAYIPQTLSPEFWPCTIHDHNVDSKRPGLGNKIRSRYTITKWLLQALGVVPYIWKENGHKSCNYLGVW